VGLAAVSYHCLEKPFLELKSRFAAESIRGPHGEARTPPQAK